MTALPVVPPECVVVNGVVADVMSFQSGTWRFRCPDIYPASAQCWDGPHASRQAALDDLARRTALPVLTRQAVEAKRYHDHLNVVDGVPMVLHLCRLTGATVLIRFVLDDGGEVPTAVRPSSVA